MNINKSSVTKTALQEKAATVKRLLLKYEKTNAKTKPTTADDMCDVL